DPMCSWCWAFQPVWSELRGQLPDSIRVRYLLGGLAADSDAPMAELLQHNIKAHWRRIQQVVPGTVFNFDFWQQCTPRRSTYPACRAVIAARKQDASAEQSMIRAIGEAYYLQARNPSDDDVLIACAASLGLDAVRFQSDMNSNETRRQLQHEIRMAAALDTAGFPSLVLETAAGRIPIQIDYCRASPMLDQILSALSG
ncbi:MAG: DsbA family protein, partial [Mariprofundaceae bacterium]